MNSLNVDSPWTFQCFCCCTYIAFWLGYVHFYNLMLRLVSAHAIVFRQKIRVRGLIGILGYDYSSMFLWLSFILRMMPRNFVNISYGKPTWRSRQDTRLTTGWRKGENKPDIDGFNPPWNMTKLQCSEEKQLCWFWKSRAELKLKIGQLTLRTEMPSQHWTVKGEAPGQMKQKLNKVDIKRYKMVRQL